MKVLYLLLIFVTFFICSCETDNQKEKIISWVKYDESEEVKSLAEHPIQRMRFKRIQPHSNLKLALFLPFEKELLRFGYEKYQRLKPLILEKTIPELQGFVSQGELSYYELTLFYLYRIYHFETNPEKYLNAIISLNPDIIKQARSRDIKRRKEMKHPLYGIPILLKDNINTTSMPTTAGAAVLEHNFPPQDAILTKKLKDVGALILGKTNLSEWAYYFCSGCPLGYSYIGGQSLNPYGRKIFETGGSSSGSGTAIAANYAVAAIGTETSGSILSPSSKNALVGLKPTIGSVSRNGMVPISGTLDTAGPMTKSVIDAAILMSAISGYDSLDSYSYKSEPINYQHLENMSLRGVKFGLIKAFASDSLMQNAVQKIENNSGQVIQIHPPQIEFQQFIKILDVDMKIDLPNYLVHHASETIEVKNIDDIVAFNVKDSMRYAPYNQSIFRKIITDTLTKDQFEREKMQVMSEAVRYFQEPMQNHELDVIISINNYTAAYAAAAHYPALTVPMGFNQHGEPYNITFIAPSKQEQKLFEIGAAFERISKQRRPPEDYR
ncbi:MAG: amidase family protein [Flavobacteriaceae bacterium]|nr:amidase family protein [Flavobacteriaceae bacterium]